MKYTMNTPYLSRMSYDSTHVKYQIDKLGLTHFFFQKPL